MQQPDAPAGSEGPAPERARHDRVASGLRPPRWTIPVPSDRVRLSAGMVVWLVASVGIAGWRPQEPVAWAPLLAAVSVILSTLVHEGAHAWAAHNLGYHVEWVVLGGLAGVTAYFGRDDRPLDRAAVALAGPAASGVLVLVLAALRAALPSPSTGVAIVEVAIGLNLLGLLANLLPLGGTDGAHLVRGLSEHRRRSRPAGRGRRVGPTAASPAPRPPL
jgi:Zn-dependent protease